MTDAQFINGFPGRFVGLGSAYCAAGGESKWLDFSTAKPFLVTFLGSKK